MHLGLDFDNTIVSYDKIFHKVARDRSLIDDLVPISKISVRDCLKNQNMEDVWTEMQAFVYGTQMDHAELFPGVIETLEKVNSLGYKVSIVSHKTRYPYLGPKYDLHQSAQSFIVKYLGKNGPDLISEDNIYFEETKINKLARISTIGCTLFLDDLPEILLSEAFPNTTKPLLFDPNKEQMELTSQLTAINHWIDLISHIKH